MLEFWTLDFSRTSKHTPRSKNPSHRKATMLSTLALATMIPTAFISIDTSPFFYNDLIAVQAMMRPPPSSSWRCTDGECIMSYPVSHLEDASLRLVLGDDGKTITLSGERKIEGCQCQPRDDVIITLPFTPSAPEALSSSIDKGRLTITLLKHAKIPEAKTISIKRPEPKTADASQIRFVPQESASASVVEEKMLDAFDKFRAVAALARKDGQETLSQASIASETVNATAQA